MASPSQDLAKLFHSKAEHYLGQRDELRGKYLHGYSAAGPGSGKSLNAAGKGSKNAGGFPAGQSRNGPASSLAAVSTRVGKYGRTKLKPGTVAEFRKSGFNVGAPVKTPNRTGENNAD